MNYFEIHVHSVNSNLVLSGVVLPGSSQETMREVKPIDPEEIWDSCVDPLLEEIESFF